MGFLVGCRFLGFRLCFVVLSMLLVVRLADASGPHRVRLLNPNILKKYHLRAACDLNDGRRSFGALARRKFVKLSRIHFFKRMDRRRFKRLSMKGQALCRSTGTPIDITDVKVVPTIIIPSSGENDCRSFIEGDDRVTIDVTHCGAKPHELYPWFDNSGSFVRAIEQVKSDSVRLNRRGIVKFPGINGGAATYYSSPLRFDPPTAGSSVRALILKDTIDGTGRNFGKSIELVGDTLSSGVKIEIKKFPYTTEELQVFDVISDISRKVTDDLIRIEDPLHPDPNAPKFLISEILGSSSVAPMNLWTVGTFRGAPQDQCDKLSNDESKRHLGSGLTPRDLCYRIRFNLLYESLAPNGYSYRDFSVPAVRQNCREFLDEPDEDLRLRKTLWEQASGGGNCHGSDVYAALNAFKSATEGKIRSKLTPLIDVVYYGDGVSRSNSGLDDGCYDASQNRVAPKQFDFRIENLKINGAREERHPQSFRTAPWYDYSQEDAKLVSIRSYVKPPFEARRYDGMVSAEIENSEITGSASDALSFLNACGRVHKSRLMDSYRGGLTVTGKAYIDTEDTVIGDDFVRTQNPFSTALNVEEVASGVGFIGNAGDAIFEEINSGPTKPNCDPKDSRQASLSSCVSEWLAYRQAQQAPLSNNARAKLRKAGRVVLNFLNVHFKNPNKIGLPIQLGIFSESKVNFINSLMDGGELSIVSTTHPRDHRSSPETEVVFDNCVLNINDNGRGSIIYPSMLEFRNHTSIILESVREDPKPSDRFSPLRIVWMRGNFDWFSYYNPISQSFSPINYTRVQRSKIRFVGDSGILLGDSSTIAAAKRAGSALHGIYADNSLDPSADNSIVFDPTSFIRSVSDSTTFSQGIRALGIGGDPSLNRGQIEFSGQSNAEELVSYGYATQLGRLYVPMRYLDDSILQPSNLPLRVYRPEYNLLQSQPSVLISNPTLLPGTKRILNINWLGSRTNLIFDPDQPIEASRMGVLFDPLHFSRNLFSGNRFLFAINDTGSDSLPLCMLQGDMFEVRSSVGIVARRYFCDEPASNADGDGQIWRLINH